MSDLIDAAVSTLKQKMQGGLDDGTAKFVIGDEGAIMVDANGPRAGDEPADVTLTADAETFQAIMAGDINPAAAFMTGKLSVDGDMGLAMKLGGLIG